MKRKILYIEDEVFLGKVVRESLENKGFEVLLEGNGAKVMQHFKSFMPHVCVVDVMLPHIDGYTLAKTIRNQYPAMPIIFLTAKTQTQDVVKGFESGGTDYVRKPFSIEELVARIENQLHLSGAFVVKQAPVSGESTFGSCAFNASKMELQVAGKTIRLSHKENQIMQCFVRNINTVVDRKELLLSVWGDDSFFTSRTLDVYIRKFREYFAPDSKIGIITLKGKGYQFVVL
jgi:DNA-binding response OmpR family regulator